MLEILFRNQDFAAVNKPAGIAVHQEEGADNLLAMAAARRPSVFLNQVQIGFRAFETEAYIGAVERFVWTSRPAVCCCLL